MNRKQNKIMSVTAVVAMFLFIIAMLLTSFQLVIYGDPEYRFYEKEYEKYTVTEALDMKIVDVMKVTDYMMAYLIGEEDELSIVTEVDGQTQDFFNEQDRLHMADVKNLFLGGLKLRTVCLIVFLALLVLIIARKADWKRLLPKAYFIAVGVFLALIAFLAVAFSIDFTKCFTIFHKIFFTNDLWLFDEDTDYMIRMLPEGFFSDMVIRISEVFGAVLVVIWIVLFVIKKYYKKPEES